MHRLDTFPGRELIGQYRQVFSTRSGLDVLSHILFELGVFQPTENDGDVVLQNYGNRLLEILAGGEIAVENLQEFAERIMRQPVKDET